MPYISEEKRKALESKMPETTDELTYQIYKKITDYLYTNGYRWKTMSEVMAAMESAKLEFYRREVAPYEDIKIEENGDV